MAKRSHYEIVEKVILKLKEKESNYSELEKGINTGHRTVKLNLVMLEKMGLVKQRKEEHHKKNARESYYFSLTDEGKKVFESLKKLKNKI